LFINKVRVGYEDVLSPYCAAAYKIPGSMYAS